MKFDFSEILSSALMITWKHKVLWLFSWLPIFFLEASFYNTLFFIESPVFDTLRPLFFIFISYILYGIASSAVILGVVRVDGYTESLTFRQLFNDSKPYWWRVLGVILLIGLSASFLFLVLFGCIAVIGLVMAGKCFICVLPFYLLLFPTMIVLYATLELSQIGVVAEKLSTSDSMRRGWELVRANFWHIFFILLTVFLGIGLLSIILTLPLMSPFLFLPFFIETKQLELNLSTRLIGVYLTVILLIIAFVQGIGITYLKSTYTIMYLRLTKPQDNAPVVIEANA